MGAGTGTSDSINARLSNGEFVIRASETKKNIQLLQAINSGSIDQSRLQVARKTKEVKAATGGLIADNVLHLNKGGLAQGFADGGVALRQQANGATTQRKTTSNQTTSAPQPVSIKNITVFDKESLQSELLKSDEATQTIVSVVQENRDLIAG